MKKKLLYALFALCSSSALAQTEKYVINGSIYGPYNADKVYLVSEEFINGPQKNIDSCIVKDGRFKFEGQVPEFVTLHFIKSADPNSRTGLTPVFLEPGNISVKVTGEHFTHNAVVKGTVNNELLTHYFKSYNQVLDSVNNMAVIDWYINGRTDEKEEVEFPRRNKLIKTRSLDIQKDLVTRFNAQVFAPFMIYWEMRRDMLPKELRLLQSQLDPKLANHPYAIALRDFIIATDFGVGNKMPDFEMPDMNGEEVKWKDYAGKYVFIDFWASWCGPCLRELPNVVKLYEECKGPDFEIVGISLDDNKEKWLKAIKDNNMTWPQLSELKGWDTQIAKLCNVSGIPFTILVDPKGDVVALNLRGEELVKKVKELTGKK